MKLVSDDLKKCVALSLVQGLGPATFRKLLDKFGSLDRIWSAELSEFKEIPRSTHVSFEQIFSQDILKKAELEIQKAHDRGAAVIGFFDEAYPALLKEIYDPPMALYVMGNLPGDSLTAIGLVGSRSASDYGIRMAHLFGQDFAKLGAVVVSGLAMGIDASAHEGALAGGGLTVGVLGGGLTHGVLKTHEKLAKKMIQSGAIISEYPMDVMPRPEYFPVRNRIISGLSRAVVVVEAMQRSGALITVDSALDQNREVFAVPGPVDSLRSEGTHALLKQGAKLALSAQDVLNEISGVLAEPQFSRQAKIVDPNLLNEKEKIILARLERQPALTDDLIEALGVPASEAIVELTQLEMKGFIRRKPGNFFERAI